MINTLPQEEYSELISRLKDLFSQDGALHASKPCKLLISHLKNETTFFTDPASRGIHHVCVHGLLKHCFEVYDNFLMLCNHFAPSKNTTEEEAFLAAFGHDLAKTGIYTVVNKRVNIGGNWVDSDVFDYKDKWENNYNKNFALEHQTESLDRLYRICKDANLIPQWVANAIRYHHGPFAEVNLSDYDRAVCCDIRVSLLHIADNLSAQADKCKTAGTL